MIQILLFLLLKPYDLIAHLFVKKTNTRVTFHHPDQPHLMQEFYQRKKENPQGTFYVEADPDDNGWNEYIKVGSSWLHNYYRLDVKERQWQGSPTWRTFTTAVVASFHLDFSKADQTTLTLHAKSNVTDQAGFQSWFKYCRSAGVQQIEVKKG